jgi:hypothetical protein
MKSNILSKTAGITMLITGLGHTTTHFLLQFSQHPHPELEAMMKNAKLQIGAEISVHDFHNGFSLTMGVLLIGLGVQIFRTIDKKGLYINSILTGLIMAIAICYFPPFVMVLTAISFISLLINLLRYGN